MYIWCCCPSSPYLRMCVCVSASTGLQAPSGLVGVALLATPEAPATHLLLIRARRRSYLGESWSSHRRGIITLDSQEERGEEEQHAQGVQKHDSGDRNTSNGKRTRHGSHGRARGFTVIVPLTVNKCTAYTQTTAPGSSFPHIPTVCPAKP